MMLKRIFRHICRQPISALAVVLFAGVLATVLCYLHQAGVQEQERFEQTYASVPVTFRVTDLDGSKPGNIEGWIVDLFGEQGLQPNLEPYVGELYVRVDLSGECAYTVTDESGLPQEVTTAKTVAGIGSLYVAEELTENWGGAVYWHEGYDESIFASEELVCLVPEEMQQVQQVRLTFTAARKITDYKSETVTTEKTLKVVGYYVDKGNTRLYAPYDVSRLIHAELGVSKNISELCAVLNDNNSIDALREAAALWFAQPNPAGYPTEWGRFGYSFYLYALDIDDTMLTDLEYSMKNSMRLNKLASAAIFVLSAGAGFLTGFLVIRARKREIALMRTMGASNPSIFTELALEQFLCVAAGVALGGSSFLWQPAGRLCIFGAIYFIGLAVALVVFLKKNLLTTIKEDE